MKKSVLAKIISCMLVLLIPSFAFAQDEDSAKKFSGVTFVSFKTHLTYNIGQDTAAYPAARTLKPFAINKYETCYNLWYQTRIKAEKIGYYFRNLSLLETALTHSSYVNEHPREHPECYERLEFLGDSILGMVTAELLYRWEPALPEGKMTRIRAELVCEESLYRVAAELDFGQWMRLGKGEEKSRGRERPSILADMVEAVIAAIYLDSGMDEARRFILTRILKDAEISDTHRVADYKTRLQELVQRKSDQHIAYVLTEESGPDHDKRFTFEVRINGVPAGTGSGRTKKEAEQMAARRALESLTE